MIIKNQKSKIKNLFLICAIGFIAGCQQPDDLTPPVALMGINSITTFFVDEKTGETYPPEGYSGYPATTTEGVNELVVILPFYYPESSTNEVTEDMLKNMRVRANLDDNVTVSPALLYMDMTKSNTITVTNLSKETKQYIVRAEVKKSAACAIEEFIIELPTHSVTGIINETDKVISLLEDFDVDEPVYARLRLSHHASISPDPRVVALDYDQENELTVTAHDGETKAVYTVMKNIAPKVELGIRPNSGSVMFAKQLNTHLGITTINMTEGIAVTRDHVIIHTRGENSIYIDAKTGEYVDEIDLGDVKGDYITADKAGNVLICNRPAAGTTFNVWRLDKSLNGDKVNYIEWESTHQINKISVQGNLDEDAIITAALLYPWIASQTFSKSLARWTVVDGDLTSQEPEVVTIISGLDSEGWSFNCDIVHTSATDINADYFMVSYQENALTRINGNTNNVRDKILIGRAEDAPNFVTNSVDYIEFNNAQFATLSWANRNSWGAADIVWLLDVTNEANFSGRLQIQTCPAVVWECPPNYYSWRAINGGVSNDRETGDVALSVSPDGYFLYLYFMFTNGFIVGVQFDCIDM